MKTKDWVILASHLVPTDCQARRKRVSLGRPSAAPRACKGETCGARDSLPALQASLKEWTYVESAVDNQQSDEDAVSLSSRGDPVGVTEVGGGSDHLGESKLGRSNSSDLSEEVKPEERDKGQRRASFLFGGKRNSPSNDPADDGAVLAGDEVGRSRVEATIGRVRLQEGRSDEKGDRSSQSTRDEPRRSLHRREDEVSLA